MPQLVPNPMPDVETVAEETDAHEVNKMLRGGWVLLAVVGKQDSGGGYTVYVIGKVRQPAR